MEPVAYIRRSARSRSDPGDLSREFQTAAVRELANGDGARLRIIDADWGRSASTDKTDQRVAFLALLEAVEHGKVSALYAYSTDRLARSVEWAARLLNACRRAGTVIVTSEGRFEPDNAMTDQLFYFQAMQNEGYSRQATEKRRATVVRQRARGEKLGPPFYGALPGEDLEAVLEAFDATGSTHAAAVKLNRDRVPTRRGGPWAHGAVRNILARAAAIPKLGREARNPRRRSPCTDCSGVTVAGRLTPVRQPTTNLRDRVIYRCVQASSDPSHGRSSTPESRILPAIRAEADRLRPSIDQVATAARQGEALESIEARRALVVDTYVDRKIDKADRDRRLAALDAEEDALRAAQRVRRPAAGDRLDVGPTGAERLAASALGAGRVRQRSAAGPVCLDGARMARVAVLGAYQASVGVTGWRSVRCPQCDARVGDEYRVGAYIGTVPSRALVLLQDGSYGRSRSGTHGDWQRVQAPIEVHSDADCGGLRLGVDKPADEWQSDIESQNDRSAG